MSDDWSDSVVRRAGPPEPRAIIVDSLYRFAVPLSVTPSERWVRIYQEQTEDGSPLYHPTEVIGAHIVFDADEESVPRWVQAVDGWIGGANDRDAQSRRREREHESRHPEEAARVAREFARLREKFKTL